MIEDALGHYAETTEGAFGTFWLFGNIGPQTEKIVFQMAKEKLPDIVYVNIMMPEVVVMEY